MVDKKDVYTRREFFKKSCGKVLPAICLTISSYYLLGCRTPKVETRTASVETGKDSSQTTCKSSCQASCTRWCHVGCSTTVKGGCATCQGSCSFRCSTSCAYGCIACSGR